MRFLSVLLLIRVLCIGNSFSWDAVEQELVPLCDAKGIEVEIHKLASEPKGDLMSALKAKGLA